MIRKTILTYLPHNILTWLTNANLEKVVHELKYGYRYSNFDQGYLNEVFDQHFAGYLCIFIAFN